MTPLMYRLTDSGPTAGGHGNHNGGERRQTNRRIRQPAFLTGGHRILQFYGPIQSARLPVYCLGSAQTH